MKKVMEGAEKFIRSLPGIPQRFYGWLLNLIGYIIGATSDQAAEIAARAMPLVVPIPNAISVYLVSQSHLGFNGWQALAFAAAIEISMFAVIEVALYIFDGYMEDKEKYKLPLWISIIACILVLVIIIVFVIVVELSVANGHPVLAMLSLLSAAAAVMLALKRWRKRDVERSDAQKVELENQEIRRLEEAGTFLTNRVSELSEQVSELQKSGFGWQSLASQLRDDRDGLAKFVTNLETEIARRDAKLEALEGQIAFLEGQNERMSNVAFSGVSEPQKPGFSKPKPSKNDPAQRRLAVLMAATEVGSKSELNFAELARTYGVSDTMVRKDLSWLEGEGLWLNHDKWEPTAKGRAWIEQANA
jgi:membrane protein implicated in regulation of membrane protease activity